MVPDNIDKDGGVDADELDAEYGEIPEIPDDGDEWEALAAEAIKAAESATAAVRPDPIDEETESPQPQAPAPQPATKTKPTSDSAPPARPTPWLIVTFAAIVLLNAGMMAVLLLRLRQPPEPRRPAPPINVAPAPQNAPPEVAREVVEPPSSDPIATAREKLGAGYLSEATSILEDLLESGTELTSAQKITIFLMLSRTHRELGDVDQASYYAQLASGELIDEVAPGDVIERADAYLARGEYARARRLLYTFLARADSVQGNNENLEAAALIKIGDTFRDEALGRGNRRPVPMIPGRDAVDSPAGEKGS